MCSFPVLLAVLSKYWRLVSLCFDLYPFISAPRLRPGANLKLKPVKCDMMFRM